MKDDVFTNYEPVDGIASFSCGYLTYSFTYKKDDDGFLHPELSVIMHQAGVGERSDRDLLIVFNDVIAMRWSPDSYSGLDKTHLSKVRNGGSTCALRYSNSSLYLKKYIETYPHLGTGHLNYFMCAENDLLEVIALPDAKAQWMS